MVRLPLLQPNGRPLCVELGVFADGVDYQQSVILLTDTPDVLSTVPDRGSASFAPAWKHVPSVRKARKEARKHRRANHGATTNERSL